MDTETDPATYVNAGSNGAHFTTTGTEIATRPIKVALPTLIVIAPADGAATAAKAVAESSATVSRIHENI